jgi:hypothetical protein
MLLQGKNHHQQNHSTRANPNPFQPAFHTAIINPKLLRLPAISTTGRRWQKNPGKKNDSFTLPSKQGGGGACYISDPDISDFLFDMPCHS